MSHFGRTTTLVLLTLAVLAGRLPAQSRTTLAFDAEVGAGKGKGGEFFDRGLAETRLAMSVRRSTTARLGVFAEASWDVLGWSQGHYTVCYISSRGGCADSYPELSGPAGLVGLSALLADRAVELRAGVGGGAYQGDGPRVGGIVSQADVAAFPFSHVGLLFSARWVVVPRYLGDKLSMRSAMFGLRIR